MGHRPRTTIEKGSDSFYATQAKVFISILGDSFTRDIKKNSLIDSFKYTMALCKMEVPLFMVYFLKKRFLSFSESLNEL